MENDYYYFLNTDKKKEIWIQNRWLGGGRLEVLWLENTAYWKLKCTNVPGSKSVVEAKFCLLFVGFLKPMGSSYLKNQALVSFSRVLPLPTRSVSSSHHWSCPALTWPGGPSREQKSLRQKVLPGWKSVTPSHPNPFCRRNLPPLLSFTPSGFST